MRMGYARIDFDRRMNRVDRGNRMDRPPRPGGGLYGVGTSCDGFKRKVLRYRPMIDS